MKQEFVSKCGPSTYIQYMPSRAKSKVGRPSLSNFSQISEKLEGEGLPILNLNI